MDLLQKILESYIAGQIESSCSKNTIPAARYRWIETILESKNDDQHFISIEDLFKLANSLETGTVNPVTKLTNVDGKVKKLITIR